MASKELSPRYAALAAAIEAKLADKVRRLPSRIGELGYEVSPADLLDVCRVLRDDEEFNFQMLMDVAGVDYSAYGNDEWQTNGATETGFSRGRFRDAPEFARDGDVQTVAYRPAARFGVTYHLLSIAKNWRLRLKTFCADDRVPVVDSVIPIWASADWYEREAFDLYGILFRGHPDLRRLLTDYGFIGHPFRKDFPLGGNVEMRYDPEKGRVVYEPVSIEPRTLVPRVIREDNRYEAGIKDSGNA